MSGGSNHEPMAHSWDHRVFCRHSDWRLSWWSQTLCLKWREANQTMMCPGCVDLLIVHAYLGRTLMLEPRRSPTAISSDVLSRRVPTAAGIAIKKSLALHDDTAISRHSLQLQTWHDQRQIPGFLVACICGRHYSSISILFYAVAALHQGAPGQMTWLEDPPPWLRPAYCFALLVWTENKNFTTSDRWPLY